MGIFQAGMDLDGLRETQNLEHTGIYQHVEKA